MRRERRWVAVGFALIATVWLSSHLDPPMPSIHGDGYYTYLYARSLVFDGDWDLTNDYELCGDPWRMRTRMGPPEPGMRPHNPWNPGPALVWAPLLAYARATFVQTGHADPKIANACQGSMAEFAMLGTVLAGLITLWLAYRFARRHVSRGAAFLGVMGVGLASALPYYATLLPSYNHALAAFGVALVLERWDATRGSRRWYRWLLLGVLLGVSMLMRAQTALVALAPLVEWLWLARQDLRMRRWKRLAGLVGVGALFVGVALLVFSPQLYLWKTTYGVWYAVPQGEHFMRWSTPHIDGVFWGSTGGLLVWTPVLYFSFFGLLGALLGYQRRFVAVALLLVLAAVTYVNASAYDYFGSAGLSNRRFTGMSLIFAVGIAFSAEWLFAYAKRKPHAFAAVTMACVVLAFAGWNYANMWGVAKGRIPSYRERPTFYFWRMTFDQLSENVWEGVGNPFAWPASIPFAVIHDTHPRRYDVMRGMAVFYQNEQTREPRTRGGEHEAKFHRPYQFEYAVEGFAEEMERVEGKRSAVTTGDYARMLVPFFWDDVASIEVHWRAVRDRDERDDAAQVSLVWNGVPIATENVGGRRWHTTTIAIPPGVVEVGINELEWHVGGGPVAFHTIAVQQIPREHEPASVR